MGKAINVGIVGTQFMGRAHSNAYLDVGYYFDLDAPPVMKAACDINKNDLDAFCKRYGWQTQETDWKKLIERDDIDLVDIVTPNFLHKPVAVEAARKGKHIICEKPMAMDAQEAREMRDAAREANVRNMLAFNYRRVPAVCLAKKLIEEGKLGTIYHFNAVYYQDWQIDPNVPYLWRHDKSKGGSGAHGDMNAHIVDLGRYLVGEISSVCCAQEVFVKERKKPDGTMGQVTADDAAYFMARFREGALGVFLASRMACGRKNFLRFEIFGSQGAINFNLERLNELEYYSLKDDPAVQGFRNLIVTEAVHPYIDMWWPPGHILGWEHTFIHEVGDLIKAIEKGTDVQADFHDGMRCQQVIDAAIKSHDGGKWVDVPEE
ncbi:MAG: gfo/Idh/MocA family oxidoreductase [Chitinivibrionales bacterium]|nr:gfo/Idh/MocA family oxidoreductase [Chitinivibrionales bacterium]MBD3394800.1 gfo/Idh/MocA family oxidoreductase [Chitinivibrionales bacterium]